MPASTAPATPIAPPPDWDSIALVGLDKPASPDLAASQAQDLLVDLLAMPQGSRLPGFKQPGNIAWRETCLASDPRAGREGNPKGAVGARIRALVERGADPHAARALHRATHRGSLEEARALLALPNPPLPSQTSSSGATALHRAAYDGPDELFALLAERAAPEDWSLKDKDGRSPLEKAFMSRRIRRATLAAEFTTPDLDTDANGNGFFHRFADFINAVPETDQRKWMPIFTRLLAKSAQLNFSSLNHSGQTPIGLLSGSGLAASLMESAILLLDTPSTPAEPAQGARRPRSRL